ncbi:C39 family peptidase [Lysobacter sp. K5869]|uniref:C39 family peptidase n=1 Tax=Lysobacter sp. K5869 TaxID=2820808 RepID=UPI001C064807|nr:C39 family peptidase [Lysobacter sp. K5869]QWP77723.1 C39 family peptidase [Lysobacter sp. K5869]
MHATASLALSLALALAACGGARAQSAVSPGERYSAVDLTRLTGATATPVVKPMRTLRDLRYRELLRQRYDFSCGSAALASLLHYGYGLDVDEPALIEKMMVGVDPHEVVRNGFSMLDMKRYVEGIGLRAHGFRIDADALYRLQMPVIALLDIRGYRHFVVVKGAAGGRVFVADPALGHRVMPEAEFVRGWNGIVLAVVGDKPMRADSYLVGDRSSPALRRRGDALERATAAPRAVEYTLSLYDLF